MKKIIVTALTLFSSECIFSQTTFVANYDESKVGSYILPNPLQKADGSLVKTQLEWEKQRVYLLQLLADNEYGILPTAIASISYKILEINKEALVEKLFASVLN